MTSEFYKGYEIKITALRIPDFDDRWQAYAVILSPAKGQRNRRVTPNGGPFRSKRAAEERALKIAREYIDDRTG